MKLLTQSLMISVGFFELINANAILNTYNNQIILKQNYNENDKIYPAIGNNPLGRYYICFLDFSSNPYQHCYISYRHCPDKHQFHVQYDAPTAITTLNYCNYITQKPPKN